MNKLFKTGIIFLLSSFITLQAAEFESNVALSNTSVAENATNATVGTVSYTDDGLGTETLSLSGTDAARPHS